MNMQKALETWNGKSTDNIRGIYQQHSSTPSFQESLVKLIENERCQKSVTWLLKYHLELGHHLNRKQTSIIYKSLNNLKHWESKLHVLQAFEYMPIAKTDKRNVERFLRVCLTDTNNFVRAWAYNGFYVLSLQYSEHKEEALVFFDIAMKDETPAVKARVRNIMKNISRKAKPSCP